MKYYRGYRWHRDRRHNRRGQTIAAIRYLTNWRHYVVPVLVLALCAAIALGLDSVIQKLMGG